MSCRAAVLADPQPEPGVAGPWANLQNLLGRGLRGHTERRAGKKTSVSRQILRLLPRLKLNKFFFRDNLCNLGWHRASNVGQNGLY